MTKKQLASILKYSSPKEIYIITQENILKLIIVPFKVKVLTDVGDLFCGQEVYVDEIKITWEIKTVFIIQGKPYYYYHFDIIV